MSERLRYQDPNESIRQAFRVMDLNSEISPFLPRRFAPSPHELGNILLTPPPLVGLAVSGFISLEDLRSTFAEVAPQIPDSTIVEAFNEVDEDKDGRVTYRDFERLFQNQVAVV